MESDPNIRFNIKHGMWTTGTRSPYDLIIASKRYTIKGTLSNIQCQTLVLEAEKDDSFPGQPKKVYDGLTSASIKGLIYFLRRKRVLKNTVNVALLRFQIKEYLIGWMKHSITSITEFKITYFLIDEL